MRGDLRSGEILQVPSDDRLGTASDRRRKHMPVVRIGQGKARNQAPMVGDIGVRQDGFYHVAGGLEARDRCAGRIGGQIAYPFRVNVVGPARGDQAIEGALDQQIAQMEGIEDAGVVDRDGRSRGHD